MVVKVANNGSGNKYTLEGVSQKTISLVKGFTYTFNISDSSVAGHPIKFSTTSDGSHASGTEYTTGVTSGDTSITFAVPSELHQHCITIVVTTVEWVELLIFILIVLQQ